jgi:hypothetical protein
MNGNPQHGRSRYETFSCSDGLFVLRKESTLGAGFPQVTLVAHSFNTACNWLAFLRNDPMSLKLMNMI